MKRLGSRQRARENIAQMIAKIERLEAARREGDSRISQRIRGIIGGALKAVSASRLYARMHQGRDSLQKDW